MENNGAWARSGGIDLRPEHFDGHTEFGAMTPEQRLLWLSEIAKFVLYVREQNFTGSESNASD